MAPPRRHAPAPDRPVPGSEPGLTGTLEGRPLLGKPRLSLPRAAVPLPRATDTVTPLAWSVLMHGEATVSDLPPNTVES